MDSGELLRAVELRLLRCTLPPPPSLPPPLPTPNPTLENLLTLIERGDYAAALSSPAARSLSTFTPSSPLTDSVDSAAQFYHHLDHSLHSLLAPDVAWLDALGSDSDSDSDAVDDGGAEHRFALVLCVGVAAMLAFVQQNVTGPVGDFSPFPLTFPGSDGVVYPEWDNWARGRVEAVGAHLDARFSLLQYIVYAKVLLSKTQNLSKESCRSSSWWLCRLILLEQRILDELSSSLYNQLQVCKEEMLIQFGRLENVTSYWASMLSYGEASRIASVAQLEAGILECKYGRVDSSRLHLRYAEELCGMHLSVTGVLGFRRVHQVNATSQRKLVANTDQPNDGDQSLAKFSLSRSAGSVSEEKGDSRLGGRHESSDVLLTPRLVENGDDAKTSSETVDSTNKETTLNAIQQAVVLAQCLPLSRSSREDEFSNWEMAPYIEAIDAQQHSWHIVQTSCDILRIRWESTRSSTKERSFLMMDKLVAVVFDPSPVSAERIQLAFAVEIPTIPALRKDYALHCIGCGMIPEALKILEDLELWNPLIDCYSLLGKKAAAVNLIEQRLLDKPTDPRLWCSLGDVKMDYTCYEKALEVSNNKSARAMRGLARCAYNRRDYKASKIHWDSAMAVNSLFPGGWFALGTAALQDQDMDKALDAFTRAVQIDPDNGEAWNNIGYLHLLKKNSRPAFIAFREALKFRRSSWHSWENYSKVAFDIGNFQQALEATRMVLDLTSNKRVNVELLDDLISIVEDRISKPVSSFNGLEGPSNSTTVLSAECGNSGSVCEEARETEILKESLENILKQITGSGGGDVWGLNARWHKIKGDLPMCFEAHMRQVRSYKGSELWHDLDRFKKFAQASLQLCKVSMEIASSTGRCGQLTTAEMDLRNSMKQAVNFIDTEEFKELQSCLQEMQKLLHEASTKDA